MIPADPDVLARTANDSNIKENRGVHVCRFDWSKWFSRERQNGRTMRRCRSHLTSENCRTTAFPGVSGFREVCGTRAWGLWVEVGVAILLDGR